MQATGAQQLVHGPARFDCIAFLRKIVAIDSCDPPGREIEIARLVHEQLLAMDVDAELDEFQPGRANVLGRIRGTGEKPSFVLSAHMDTVPIGSLPWRRDAFSADVSGDRLHGRGASDMKGALVAMMAAAGELAKRRGTLKGDVVLALTAGESANLLGARRFAQQGLKREIGAFLCGEPSNLDIVIVEKAALWLRVTAKGRLGHVSGDAGVNAIIAMNQFLIRLAAIELSCPAHPLLDAPTIRVGRIEGGSAVNLTPDRCIADLDIRLPPGVDHRHVIEQVEAITADGISVGILDFKPAVESAADDPFVTLCGHVCARHTGRTPELKGVAYYSDGTVLVDGLDVPFAIIGPGDLGLSGQPDESVSIDNVLKAAEIYADVAAAWLSR